MEMTSKEYYRFLDELYSRFLAGEITEEEACKAIDDIEIKEVMINPIFLADKEIETLEL